VLPIFLEMQRRGIGEVRITRIGLRCVFDLIPEGDVAQDVSPLSDGSEDSDKSDQVRPVCENCSAPATWRAVHWEAGGVHACEDCMKAHLRDYSQVRRIWPPPATG
jgi:hypothetical protein